MSQRHEVGGHGPGELRLGRYAAAVERRLESWRAQAFGKRLWQKDPTLWTSDPKTPEIANRLGWLDLPESMRSRLAALQGLAEAARSDGLRDAVVLGMGGSSLAPEVFARTFGPAPGYPAGRVLDSTHPAAVAALAADLDLARTWFVVSSKSGTTTEMLSFFYLFWDRLAAAAATPPAERGRHFVAVTDPGTPLAQLARERRFRALVEAPPDVGGRYSALTPFGLVPAGLTGVDLDRLLGAGRRMAEACGGDAAPADNPGLRLGAALGELTLAGRDKVTFAATPGLASFPLWLEQLIAESTGKIGRGIVPVAGEPLGPPEAYGEDRFFVALQLGDEGADLDERLDALERAGHPVARFRLAAPSDLASEMFRWEVAVAAAGSIVGVNPFDQPDVQLAKELAGKAMKALAAAAPGRRTGHLPGGAGLPRAGRRRRRGARRLAGRALPPHALRHHSRLRPALPAFDRPAAQGRPGERPLPAAGGRAGRGPAGAGDRLQLRDLDPRPGAGRPRSAAAARPPRAARRARRRRRRRSRQPGPGGLPPRGDSVIQVGARERP